MEKKSTKEIIEYIKNNHYTDIIFDCDETLMHLIIDWSSTAKKYEEFAKKLDLEKESKLMEKNRFLEFVLIEKWLQYQDEINEISWYCEDHCHEKTVLNKELIHFVKESYTDYNFYILSNNMERIVYSETEKVWLQDCFKKIICRNTFTFAKPNPEGINYVIEKSWGEKSKVLMVGDNDSTDGESARRAGIDYCLIDMYL